MFRTANSSREAQYCNVDVLRLQDSRVKVIVEIEESGVKPIKICGKMMTSALSKYFIHESQPHASVPMAAKVLFVQVLSLPAHGVTKSRLYQWNNLKMDIREQLPIGAISHYELLLGSSTDFQGEMGERLVSLVTGFLGDQASPEKSVCIGI